MRLRLSNIGFALVVVGASRYFGGNGISPISGPCMASAIFLFAGTGALTAIGSGFYHWHPIMRGWCGSFADCVGPCGLAGGMRAQMRMMLGGNR
jgi:hypothetical protein